MYLHMTHNSIAGLANQHLRNRILSASSPKRSGPRFFSFPSCVPTHLLFHSSSSSTSLPFTLLSSSPLSLSLFARPSHSPHRRRPSFIDLVLGLVDVGYPPTRSFILFLPLPYQSGLFVFYACFPYYNTIDPQTCSR